MIIKSALLKVTVITVVTLSGISSLIATTKPAPPPRPNIVLMLADDLGYGDVGCYGATRIKTPNIDRLCAQGVRFTDAHTPAAVCQPTRYGILSGRCYWRSEFAGDAYYFHEGEILLPKVLKDAGYNTAAFGKWHLGWGTNKLATAEFWNGELSPGPLTTGFDSYFGMPHSHSQPPYVFVENTRVVKLDPADPITLTPKRSQNWKYTHDFGGSAGAKAAHEACDMNNLDLILARKVDEFIARQGKDKPFFAYVPFYAPHVPLLPNDRFRGSSKAGELGDFIQQMDEAVGLILKSLEQHGFAENTLVVFTSDNGGCYIQESIDLGHRSMGRLLGLKGDAWEGGHRVAFMARWPKRIPAGVDCDKLLSLTDLFATFVAAAGIPLPRNAAPDSINQLPMLEHPQATPAIRSEMVYSGRGAGLRSGEWVYYPVPGPQGLFGLSFYMKQLGYRNSDYDDKGELRPDAQPAQLYNVATDLEQTTNVYGKYPEIAVQMDARLKEFLKQKKSR